MIRESHRAGDADEKRRDPVFIARAVYGNDGRGRLAVYETRKEREVRVRAVQQGREGFTMGRDGMGAYSVPHASMCPRRRACSA